MFMNLPFSVHKIKYLLCMNHNIEGKICNMSLRSGVQELVFSSRSKYDYLTFVISFIGAIVRN